MRVPVVVLARVAVAAAGRVGLGAAVATRVAGEDGARDGATLGTVPAVAG
jgi:hypothetical protein